VRRRVPPDELLDAVRDEREVVYELAALVRVPGEAHHAVGDRTRRGVVAGKREFEEEGGDLLVVEVVLGPGVVDHRRGHDRADEVVAQVPAAALGLLQEVVVEFEDAIAASALSSPAVR
jgi:hypothetical protein